MFSHLEVTSGSDFIYSEKATKFCEISTILLTTVHTVKSKVEILQNFVAFSEYMNFSNLRDCELNVLLKKDIPWNYPNGFLNAKCLERIALMQ